MDQSLNELKLIIRDMINEIAELKERIKIIEHGLSTDRAEDFFPPDRLSVQLQAENYENLGKIYDEGYHVCPIGFGEARYEPCLFCIVFLEKE